MPLPDLFATEPDADQLYRLFFAHLRLDDQYVQILDACRELKSRFGSSYGNRIVMLTFYDEFDSLCELGRYEEAWAQLREMEQVIWGNQLELCGKNLTPEQIHGMWATYSPLLYFLGRYHEGCQLLETYLAHNLDLVPHHSLAWNIVNDDVEPTHRCRVTLWHFYQKLGRQLQEWSDWDRFVDGISDQQLKVAKIDREAMRECPTLVLSLATRLLEEKSKRRRGPNEEDLARLQDPSRNDRLARLFKAFPQLSKR